MAEQFDIELKSTGAVMRTSTVTAADLNEDTAFTVNAEASGDLVKASVQFQNIDIISSAASIDQQ